MLPLILMRLLFLLLLLLMFPFQVLLLVMFVFVFLFLVLVLFLSAATLGNAAQAGMRSCLQSCGAGFQSCSEQECDHPARNFFAVSAASDPGPELIFTHIHNPYLLFYCSIVLRSYKRFRLSLPPL